MSLLLGFLLFPAILAHPTDLKVNDYILEIDETRTLKSIRTTATSTGELDLSSLDLRDLETDVFRHLENLKSLNLANNSLYAIPAFAFANLTRLERLSLADNKIQSFANVFVGLGNLRTLNVSNNLVTTIQRGCFYGLTKSTDILMGSNAIWRIDSDTFEQSSSWFAPNRRTGRSADPEEVEAAEVKERDSIELEIQTYNPFLSEPLRLKVCIQDGILKVVENLERGEELPNHCSQVDIEYSDHTLPLKALGIKGFDQGWYRVKTKQSPRILSVVLDGNDLERLTVTLLNDLPANVRSVSLAGNRIQRLERGILMNGHIETLDLSRNLVSDIEDGAFEGMRLGHLILTDNRLKSINVADALPATLKLLQLDCNGIAELKAKSFSKLVKVEHLYLAGNELTNLGKEDLQGLKALRVLDLSGNRLNGIETGSFQHLELLEDLNLQNNSISSLDKGLFFDGPGPSLTLDLSLNKFTKVTKDTLPNLPARLVTLHLGENDIRSLDVGSFIKVPTGHLSLNANNISTIARGSFDLPQLSTLILSGNRLSLIDGDSFEGLGRLEFLTLARNGIERINKGAMKNLGSLHTLDITGNPVNKKLENGALFGLSKSPATHVTLTEGSLEFLQGGVFDDA